MKRNPVIPYAVIAVLGILTVLVISLVGVGQRDDIQQAEEGNGEEQQEESQEGEESGEDAEGGETTEDPSEVFESNCASCHGSDLSGGAGPELAEVGDRLSEDEIRETIINGTDGGMPGGLVDDDQAEAIATWLAEGQ
ncbi:cytochrome c [Virgibacillus sp. NKC19-3]|uniref:c-type cytochrome n=1 Tax=Virgibacillus saliphilus TaxID=2831674 RepID=UPI001C9A93DB|nr:cytochrome c [Virgibacillus sp. NKC19-3]MBY7143360.1 cytochrome c [Virgibacillus sp. NKC19-3]